MTMRRHFETLLIELMRHKLDKFFILCVNFVTRVFRHFYTKLLLYSYANTINPIELLEK